MLATSGHLLSATPPPKRSSLHLKRSESHDGVHGLGANAHNSQHVHGDVAQANTADHISRRTHVEQAAQNSFFRQLDGIRVDDHHKALSFSKSLRGADTEQIDKRQLRKAWLVLVSHYGELAEQSKNANVGAERALRQPRAEFLSMILQDRHAQLSPRCLRDAFWLGEKLSGHEKSIIVQYITQAVNDHIKLDQLHEIADEHDAGLPELIKVAIRDQATELQAELGAAR